jgi:hypothetical protein
MPGFVAEYSFDYSGQPVRQLIAFIRAQNRHHVLDLRGVSWTQNDLRDVARELFLDLRCTDWKVERGIAARQSCHETTLRLNQA